MDSNPDRPAESPQSPEPAAPPPHRSAGGGGSRPSTAGCFISVLLIVLGAALLAHLVMARQAPRLARLVPADAALFVRIDQPAELLSRAPLTELWADPREARAAVLARLEARVLEWLVPTQPLASPETLPLAQAVPAADGAAFVLVPSEAEQTLVGALLLQMPGPEEAQRIATAHRDRRAPAVIDRPASEAQDGLQPDRSGLYVEAVGSVLLVTPSRRLAQFILAPDTPLDQTLASLPVLNRTGEADVIVLARPAVLQAARRDLSSLLPWRQPLTETDPRAFLRLLVDVSEDDLSVRASAWRRPAVVDDEQTGVLSWIGRAVFWLLAIALGLVALLVAAVLLLALYFYLQQWMRGESSPQQPPVQPELSPEIREDLSANPAEFSRESRPGEEASTEEPKSTDQNPPSEA